MVIFKHSRRATFLKTELDKIKNKEFLSIKFHSNYDGTLCEKNLIKI